MIPGGKILPDLKQYLNIAFDDADTDAALIGMLDRGQVALDDYAGREQDYEKEGQARQLLFDYCRYARSHAIEMFPINFQRDLISLRERAEVEAALETAGGSSA